MALAYADFTSYIKTAHDPERLLALAKEALAGVEVDTVVGTGLSGSLALPIVAKACNARMLSVRKRGDGSHSGGAYDGWFGRRWLFVDDFVSTGDTFERVWIAVEKLRASMRECDPATGVEGPWRSEFVGTFLYEDTSPFTRAEDLHHRLRVRMSSLTSRPPIVKPPVEVPSTPLDSIKEQVVRDVAEKTAKGDYYLSAGKVNALVDGIANTGAA